MNILVADIPRSLGNHRQNLSHPRIIYWYISFVTEQFFSLAHFDNGKNFLVLRLFGALIYFNNSLQNCSNLEPKIQQLHKIDVKDNVYLLKLLFIVF